MDKTEISKQLELYSNSIIAFIAVQSLAYLYTFGTNETFYWILKSDKWLSGGLLVFLIIAYGLALRSNRLIRQKLEELNGEYGQILKTIYKGKLIVLILFGCLQCIITFFYAIL